MEILETLKSLGVTVAMIGPDKLRLEPASRVPLELVSRIREAKPQILAALRERSAVSQAERKHCDGAGECSCAACTLRGRPVTCSPACYEAESGKWIHHPWDGCTTIKARAWIQ